MRKFGVMLGCLLLCGCSVPPKSALPQFDRAPVVTRSDTPIGPLPEPQWWRRFQDPLLNQLVTSALRDSPSMATAAARARLADSSVRSVTAQYGAKLGADVGLARQRLSETDDIVPFPIGGDWYTLAGGALRLDVDFDWWGRQRAAIEAELDRSRAVRAEQIAAELAISSAVATQYLAYQLERQRAQASDLLLKDMQQRRQLQASLVRQGLIAEDSLDLLDQQLAEIRVANVVMNGSWQLRQHALAGLIGIPYNRLPPMPMRPVNIHAVSVPKTASIDLIARRADVLASRWRVEAALRDADEARAGFYPDLKLSALVGQATTDVSKLLDPSSRLASVGAAIHLPIFDTRRLKAAHRMRASALDLAVASYREAINGAGQEVSLQATNQSGYAVARQGQLDREAAASRAYDATRQRYDQGLEDMAALLDARSRYLLAKDARLAAEINLTNSQIALIKALGGGVAPSRLVAPNS